MARTITSKPKKVAKKTATKAPRKTVKATSTTGRRSSGVRKYGKAAGKYVKEEVKAYKKGTARSGKGGAPVTSRKQAIAIGLSEARKQGVKVPKKK